MVVFGLIGHANIYATTIVFVCLLFFLTLIEWTLSKLDIFAEKYNQQDIFNKLKYELMVLGILSFLIFILDAAYVTAANPDLFHAFELAHIMILFIAFSFIVQAIVLAQYAHKSGRYFLKTVRTSESELLHEYKLLVFNAKGKGRISSHCNDADDMKSSSRELCDMSKKEKSSSSSSVANESNRSATSNLTVALFKQKDYETKDQDRDRHDETDEFKVDPSPVRKFSGTNVLFGSPMPPSTEAMKFSKKEGQEDTIYVVRESSNIEAKKGYSFAKLKEDLVEMGETTLQPIFEQNKFKTFWHKIEFKIVEELFLLCHNLPREFNFGTYVGFRFQKYIAEVGNISSLAWFLLAIVVLLNLAVSELHKATQDYDCSETEDICYFYLFSYALFLDTCLNVGIIVLYLFTTYYEHMLIRSGMRRNFGVDIDQGAHNRLVILYYALNEAWGIRSNNIHTNEVHKAYIECLEKLDDLKTKESSSFLLPLQRSVQLKSSYRMRTSTFTPDMDLVTSTAAATAAAGDGAKGKLKKAPTQQVVVNRLKNIKLRYEKRERESSHHKELQYERYKGSKGGVMHYCHRFYLFLKRTLNLYSRPVTRHRDTDHMDRETKEIFFRSSPRAYFFTVEFVFLLQSFYLSVYLTQMLPLAMYYGNEYDQSGVAAAWSIALFISPMIGLYFLRLILAKSIMLHATCYLNVPLVSKVCDETITEFTLVQEVRNEILANLEREMKRQNSGSSGDEDDEEEEEVVPYYKRPSVVAAAAAFANPRDTVVAHSAGGAITAKRGVSFTFPMKGLTLGKISTKSSSEGSTEGAAAAVSSLLSQPDKDKEGKEVVFAEWRDLHIKDKVKPHVPFSSSPPGPPETEVSLSAASDSLESSQQHQKPSETARRAVKLDSSSTGGHVPLSVYSDTGAGGGQLQVPRRLSRSEEVVLPTATAAADHHHYHGSNSGSPPGQSDLLYSAASSITPAAVAAVSTPSSKTVDSGSKKDALDMTTRQKINFIRQKFEEIDLDGSGEINKLEFRQFLDSLNVFLSREKFNLLWRAVDENLSDSISEDEIFMFIFPDMKKALKEELSIVAHMREVMIQYLSRHGRPTQWAEILHETFVHFAQHDEVALRAAAAGAEKEVLVKGGKMAKTHLGMSKRRNPHLMTLTDIRLLFDKFGVDTGGEGFNLLLSTVELNEDKLVTYQAFCELVLAPATFAIIFPSKDVLHAPQYDECARERCLSLTREGEAGGRPTLLGQLRRNMSSLSLNFLGSFATHRVGSSRDSNINNSSFSAAAGGSRHKDSSVDALVKSNSSESAAAATVVSDPEVSHNVNNDINNNNNNNNNNNGETNTRNSELFGLVPSETKDDCTEEGLELSEKNITS